MKQQERLERYKGLLLDWSAKVNLIGPEARAHLDDHVAEALEAAEILLPVGEVLDFGSGGGLPAIPMAIVSGGARFHLVESDQRKWAFLKKAVRDCELNSVVHGDRLQRVAERLGELRFSLITSRAVGQPATWLPLLHPFLVAGARVALFEGEGVVPEINGFTFVESHRLARGSSNYLNVLQKQ